MRARRGTRAGGAPGEARGLRQQLQRPVERGIAAAEDHQALAGELRGALHPVLDGAALERLRALEADAARLERADAGGDHHRAGVEGGAGRGAHVKAPVLARGELEHFLTEMKLRLEGLDLLQQPVDQLLCPAHRQRRDVVDRLVGIELGALAARVRERIHHVCADPEQAELEYLEQPTRAGANDQDLGADRRPAGGAGWNLAQVAGFRGVSTANCRGSGSASHAPPRT